MLDAKQNRDGRTGCPWKVWPQGSPNIDLQHLGGPRGWRCEFAFRWFHTGISQSHLAEVIEEASPALWCGHLHSWSSTVVKSLSQCLQLIVLGVNTSHWCANSNQGSTTTGGCTQPTWDGRNAPGMPSLGEWEGCATGAYRISTILGHSTKTRRHRSST